jgi:hypothetical protein
MSNFTLYVLSECHRDWAQRSSQESYPARGLLPPSDGRLARQRARVCVTYMYHISQT